MHYCINYFIVLLFEKYSLVIDGQVCKSSGRASSFQVLPFLAL